MSPVFQSVPLLCAVIFTDFYEEPKKISDVMPPAQAGHIMKAIHRSLQEQSLQTAEYQLTKGSKIYWFEARIIPSGQTEVLSLIRDITEEHRKMSVLLEQKERLRTLAAMLATAQDNEQRRIADGLHGEVAQLLAAASMQLASARKCHSPKRAAQIYDRIDELIDYTCQKVRSLSFELTSSTLHRLGLHHGIVELCETMNRRHNMCFTVQGEVQKGLIDENSATIVFKAVREMLFNVLKHAGVREARVKIECEKEMIKVSVIDRGRGFPGGGPADHSLDHNLGSGMGLFGIHQLIQDLGGKMAVFSQPDVETRVVIWVPTCQ